MTAGQHNVHAALDSLPTGSAPGVVILLYHRVTTLRADPQLLCVTPRNFAQHLEAMKCYMRPVRLDELAEALHNGDQQGWSFVVTFDDGYADNLEEALPLLEAADVPATVFVVSGHIDGSREFWWDELELILFETERLPGDLSLRWADERYDFSLTDAVIYTAMDRERHGAWNVTEEGNPTARHRLYRELFDRLRPLRHDQRRCVLDALLKWAGRRPVVRHSRRILSSEQVSELARSGLVDVGSHTVTHSLLAGLSATDQGREIAGSKRALESEIGRSITAFSYPFGTRRDYTVQSVTLVREAGFRVACSNRRGFVQYGTDAFQLPRVLVRDWDADTLLRRIAETCRVA